MTPLIIPILVIVIFFVVAFTLLKFFSGEQAEKDFSVYERKPFLFDTISEFSLFKVLVELYGDRYYIFPEVNYSHLIQPKKSNYSEERRYRSRIDRKSADFIFCDKEKVVPQLIIELDGYVHTFKSKQARDEFINEITKIVGLPILHLKTNNLDREYLRNEIDKVLIQ